MSEPTPAGKRSLKAVWSVYAVMDENEKLVGLVAKNPDRPTVLDIVDDLKTLINPPKAPSQS